MEWRTNVLKKSFTSALERLRKLPGYCTEISLLDKLMLVVWERFCQYTLTGCRDQPWKITYYKCRLKSMRSHCVCKRNMWKMWELESHMAWSSSQNFIWIRNLSHVQWFLIKWTNTKPDKSKTKQNKNNSETQWNPGAA